MLTLFELPIAGLFRIVSASDNKAIFVSDPSCGDIPFDIARLAVLSVQARDNELIITVCM